MLYRGLTVNGLRQTQTPNYEQLNTQYISVVYTALPWACCPIFSILYIIKP